jgi:hypothetical protein
MTIPEIIAAIALCSCAALILVGAWVIHSRVHNSASRLLLASLLLLFVWLLVSNFVVGALSEQIDFTNPSKSAIGLIWAIGMVIPSGIALFASVCFVLVARSIERPNNSFKPKPLRGSA